MFSRLSLILISTSLQVGSLQPWSTYSLVLFKIDCLRTCSYQGLLPAQAIDRLLEPEHSSKPADHLTVDFVFYLVFNKFGQLVISLYYIRGVF